MKLSKNLRYGSVATAMFSAGAFMGAASYAPIGQREYAGKEAGAIALGTGLGLQTGISVRKYLRFGAMKAVKDVTPPKVRRAARVGRVVFRKIRGRIIPIKV